MAKLISEKDIEIMADAQHARLWDLLLHEEKTLSTRSDFFLVAEGLVVLAWGLVVSLASAHAYLFATAGLALSLVWLLSQYKALSDLSKLSARLKDVEFTKHYFAWRQECRRYLLSHEMLLVVIPALCFVGWFIALAFTS